MQSVGSAPSGVDVEVDSTYALEIAERFFLPAEFKKIISLPENLRDRQFLMYWTLKESYFKLMGAENFLQADCEKFLSGTGEVIGKNFFLSLSPLSSKKCTPSTKRSKNHPAKSSGFFVRQIFVYYSTVLHKLCRLWGDLYFSELTILQKIKGGFLS